MFQATPQGDPNGLPSVSVESHHRSHRRWPTWPCSLTFAVECVPCPVLDDDPVRPTKLQQLCAHPSLAHGWASNSTWERDCARARAPLCERKVFWVLQQIRFNGGSLFNFLSATLFVLVAARVQSDARFDPTHPTICAGVTCS